MAAAITSLGNSINTTSGTHTVTATPAVNDLIVICIYQTGNTTLVAPTDNNSDGLGTYTACRSASYSTNTGGVVIYVRDALIGSASSTVFTNAPGATTGGGIVVLKITGMSFAGLASIKATGNKVNGLAGGTPNCVMSANQTIGNPFVGILINASSPANMTQTTGYTEVLDTGYSTPTTGVHLQTIDSGISNTNTVSWGGTSATAHSAVVVEFTAQAKPSTSLNSPADTATGVSTTPTLAATATDADSNDVRHHVQIDTVNTFDTNSVTPTQVQVTGAGTGSAISVAPVFVSNTATGNLIVVVVSIASATNVVSITDSQSNTYRKAFALTASSETVELWYAYNITGGTTPTVTVTIGVANPFNVVIAEYSGVANWIDPLDKTATSSGSGGTASTGTTATTTYNKELVIAALASFSVNPDVGSGYSHYFEEHNGSSLDYAAIQDKAVTSTGTQSGTFTGTTSQWTAGIATFRCDMPLLSKVSGTDTGFADITNGADTDPFASGDQIGFTVQAANILTPNTTYYWRARAIDPTGSNAYGAFSSTRSFTTFSKPPNKILSISQAVRRASYY